MLKIIFVVFWGVMGVTKGALNIRPDTLEFGKNLSLASVLQPLWRAKLPTFNVDLINQEHQSFLARHLFLRNCSEVDQLSFICAPRFFVILKSHYWINLTVFEDDRPSVVWRYWLEPAELLLYIDVYFNALMVNKDGNETAKEVVLSGLLDIIIRTEFKLCMVHVEFYPHNLVIRDHSSATIVDSEISMEDEESLKDHVWDTWIPSFVNKVTAVVTTRDYCDKWFPPSYYDIIKY